MLKIKNTVERNKNAFNGLISKLNWARERISEVEGKSAETTPTKNTERKESEEQNKQDFSFSRSVQHRF